MRYLAAMLVLFGFLVAEGAGVSKRDQVCYDGLGCFHSSSTLTVLPNSPDQIATQFQLFTRSSRTQAVLVNATESDSSIRRKLHGLSAHRDTKFIIHGYFDSANKDWVHAIKDALLTKGDFNVIAVSWPGGSRQILNKAAANVFVVAAQVAKFLTLLQSSVHLDLSRVHLIGHSFGAQVSGNAGSKLHGAIGRITGMDPAEPFFKDLSNSLRLDKADAHFVDIIHSDAEDFNGIQGYGLFDALGHADYYPNGGVDQPGCSDSLFAGIGGIIGGNEDNSLACSHGRSHVYFLASINPPSGCHFTAHPCTSWDAYKAGSCQRCPSGGCPTMGYGASTSAHGKFYLATTTKIPYCGYEYFIEMDLTDHVDEDSFGRFYVTILGDHNSEETEFSRDDVHYHARNTETQRIAVNRNVGHVTGVKVRFHHKSGSDKTVFIHRVLVRDPATGDQNVFCTGDFQLQSDQSHSFTSHSGC